MGNPFDDRPRYSNAEADKWFDRYVLCVKHRDSIDARLVALQCRVETLFDAIKKFAPYHFHVGLKAKIEEHFKG